MRRCGCAPAIALLAAGIMATLHEVTLAQLLRGGRIADSGAAAWSLSEQREGSELDTVPVVKKGPPQLQSFYADITLNPISFNLPQGDIVVKSDFRNTTMSWHAPSMTFMLNVYRRNFDFVGPAFRHLWSRTVCAKGRCVTQYNNGTACWNGFIANFETFGNLLWHRWISVPPKPMPVHVERAGGQDCETFAVSDAKLGEMEACVTESGFFRTAWFKPVPNVVGLSNVGTYSQNMTFHNTAEGGSVRPAELQACPAWTAHLCTGHGVVNLTVYRGTNFIGGLENRDTSDAAGQGVTLGSPWSPSFIQSKYYVQFHIEVDSAFGPWRDCNFKDGRNQCTAPQSPSLARAATRMSSEQLEGSPGSMGQCDDNKYVGSWYTFPEEGKCKPGEQVGAGGCTWRVVGRPKAVRMACVIAYNSTDARATSVDQKPWESKSSGFYRAWKLDYGKAPFPNVQRHIAAAIEACPDTTE